MLDGILCHNGEKLQKIYNYKHKTTEEFIKEYNKCYKKEKFDLVPMTLEGCVVRLSDVIGYLGRDIEDAITLGILDEHVDELFELLNITSENEQLNNTIIINNLIHDLCENSSPEKALCFSKKALDLMNKIKEFNYKNIYSSERIKPSVRYFNIVINEIYNLLKSAYNGTDTLDNFKNLSNTYPKLCESFISFISNYYDFGNREALKLKNKVLFSLDNEKDYYQAIIYYISGMTDNFAIEIYNEIIHF